MPVDVVVEEDCISGDLSHYSALYVTEPHVSAAAAAAIAGWVQAGGRIFVSAGGGLLDEHNRTNVAMVPARRLEPCTSNRCSPLMLIGVLAGRVVK